MKVIKTEYYHVLTFKVSLGLVAATLLSVAVLSGSKVSATDDSVVDEINITVPVSCTLSGTGMDTHNANINNGLYVPDIGTTTLKAFCNDNAGFAIYAAGYTGNEIGGTNSNKLVGTAASSNATIDTGTATSAGNPDTSNWAMKLTTVSSPTPTYPITLDNGFGSYSAVPNSYTKVAHRDSSTDTGVDAEGATLTTTYAAYISKTQAADTYEGKVKYTLVHPSTETPLQPQTPTSGCINYFANASNAVGTMGCQSASDNATITLLASNFSRDGYGFAGWSDKFDYATNQNAKFYGPNEDITVPEGTTTNGLALYAVWIKSQGSLQDTAKVATLCGTGAGSLTTAPTDGTANLNSVSALTDQRDNQTYAIAKLADGQCWMIENLRLESRDTVGDNRFDSSITNASLAQGYGTSATYGNFGGLADAESTNFSDSTTVNSLYYSGTQSGTASINTGTTNLPAYRMPRYNNLNTTNRATNPTSNTFTDNNTTGGMYSYGNYYTWHAAIADLTYNGTNNSSVTNISLCPSGWRLPQGGDKTRITSNDDNDFWNLTVDALNGSTNPANYNSETRPSYTGTTEAGPVADKLRSYPNNFLYSGYFGTSSASNRGSYGYYWSSTAYYSAYSYLLGLSSSVVGPGTYVSIKYFGNSIRCTTGT